MELSPTLYHWLIRPQWSTNKYIHKKIKQYFNLENKKILDFGSGTGANCTLFSPSQYFGIDPDMKRINFSKKVYPNYHFDVFQNDKIPLEDNYIDHILIVAVLHHIHPEQVFSYMHEFRRVLKKDGKIIIIEPCFTKGSSVCNWFMKTNDNGNYIQNEDEYLNYFKHHGFKTKVIKKYRKCFFYHELFFYAY